MWPSESGEMVRLVEREVEEVKIEWAESRAAVSQLQTTVTEMTGKLVGLILFGAHHSEFHFF